MLGSSNSIACANIMLNSAVAESLKVYADRLERAEDFETALHDMIRKTIKDHKRIIFNGNGYDDAWIKEATEERGLSNLRTTPDAIPHILDEENVRMLTSHKVFSEAEIRSRCEITLENYCKSVMIEANAMSQIARGEILPAVLEYEAFIVKTASNKKAIGIDNSYETATAAKLSELVKSISDSADQLDRAIDTVSGAADIISEGYMIRDELLDRMSALREPCDKAELLVAKKYWPFPTYGDLLFGVR